ncbi:hypothetical protein [Pseudotabrizicola sp. L79]|uniref:hypothetical protein n=1 Tax=Pseudotabrizicola sp. L79 TaxID=3118402 RepID=UPI002F9492F3
MESEKTPIWKSSKFEATKAFSDFIAFHVRVQFLIFGAFLLLAPGIVEINIALRNGTAYASPLRIFDLIAVFCFFVYAIVLFKKTLSVGLLYLKVHFTSKELTIVRRATWFIVAAIFVSCEILLTIALQITSFLKSMEIFGVSWSEIVPFGERIWSDACFVWQKNC